LYQRSRLLLRRSARNGPAWVATQAGPPVVGS
jgi:hypothetical protein